MADWNPVVNEIFLQAVEIGSTEERRAYLESACAGDTGLWQAVDRLLQAHAQAGSFLDRPGDATMAPEAEESKAAAVMLEKPGTIVAGRYKLLQQIGEGGMGTVWMAEQLEPVRRQVALKVIKQGMDSGQVLARFEAERQALALMDHPNIAKVLDAGTSESGRPYFVMELVKGIVITKYCDEKRLTLRQRLELMIPVCQAVQHAHQKGIIHRDLKPSNVMIALYDGKPVPKVIDFGVAKATEQTLTERTLFTGYGSIVGTLEYMSPEQAGLNHVDVDTRSDVYSLGVILYELLTGSTPIDRKRMKEGALLQVLMMIREMEPPTPSTRLSSTETLATLSEEKQTELARLSRLMRGEVDWIVMKALEKDRNRRYETANSFAEDLQRYLADEPVRAGPPSASYRLRKFVKRNRAAVLGAATVLLALVAGVVGTTWGLLWALDAEQEVRAWYEEAELKTAEAQTQQGRAVLAEGKAKAEAAEARRSALAEMAAKEEAEKKERTAKYQALRAETALHAILIEQARRALELNDVAKAEQVLTTVAEPFRKTWETRFFVDLCRRKVRPLSSALAGIPDETADLGLENFHLYFQETLCCQLGFAGNNPHVLGVAPDGVITAWDPAIRRLKRSALSVPMTPIDFSENLLRLALSSDGRFLAQGGVLGDVKVWEAKTKPDKVPCKILKTAPAHWLAFSPDGRSIMAQVDPGQKGLARVWIVATGEEKPAIRNAVSRVIWTQDGNLAYLGREGGLWLQNFAAGEAKKIINNVADQIDPKQTSFSHPRSLAISNDGKRAVTTSAHLNTVEVWDTVTGQQLRSFKTKPRFDLEFFGAVAISGNGRWIAASHGDSGMGAVHLWDAETGQEIAELRHTFGATSLAISDDGRYILTGFNGRPGRLWDLHAGYEKFILKEARSKPVQWLAVDRAGDRFLSFGGGHTFVVNVWDGTTGKKKFVLPRPPVPGSLIFDPQGLRAWDLETGKQKYQLADDKTGSILCAVVSDDSRRVFAGGEDGLVRVWDLVNHRQEVVFDAHKRWGRIASLYLSGDGQLLALCGGTGSPADMPLVQVLDANTGRELFAINANGKEEVVSVALNPKAPFFVSRSRSNPAEPLKVWEIPSGRLKFVLKGYALFSVAVTPDGQRIVTGSYDGTVRLWDAATGQQMLALPHQGLTRCVAVSGDGRRIIAGNNDGKITVWDAP